LEEDDREVVVMRHLEGLRIAEIAAVLGISHSAAQSRYRRAAERLHALLSGALPEELP
jgi:DNA-directed RNA polymerase specialized sigma24 family protein